MGDMKVRLIKMNDLSIVHEQTLNFNSPMFNEIDLLKQINEKMKAMGLELGVPEIVVTDPTTFAIYVLSNLFPGYEIKNTQSGYVSGHPDFSLKHKNTQTQNVYVELKNNGDTLSKQQLLWMSERREDSEVYILDLTFDRPQVGWRRQW